MGVLYCNCAFEQELIVLPDSRDAAGQQITTGCSDTSTAVM